MDTSNTGIDSPTIATFEAQSFARLDNFTNGWAESEIHIARSPGIRFPCSNPNLDPVRPPHFHSIHIEVTHLEPTDFKLCLICCWLCGVEMESKRCVFVIVLSL